MDFTLWDWFLLLSSILGLIVFYGFWCNLHFERKGVKSLNTAVPFFGHMWKIFLGKEHFVEAVYKTYSKHPHEKYIGFYAFREPIIIIKDLELIKRIAVKDFDQFVDHRVFMDEDSDPLFGRNLFFLRGQRWKEMRVSMSPAYTGSKMKNMFPMIVECAEQSVKYLAKQSTIPPAKEAGHIEIEMKDLFTRYTSDVIASTAFGLKVDSLEEKNNVFYEMGKKATDFSGVQFLKFLGYGSFPRIMKLFKVSLFSAPVASFFKNLTHDTMKTREEKGIVRPDMIHLLMLIKKGTLKQDIDTSQVENSGFATIQETSLKEETEKTEWNNDDLTAQAMAFLLAGFDTSSSLICFMAYELSMNPDIQTKLQDEIDEVLAKNEGALSYNDLMDMKYIDMVVSETLRKWPPDSHLDRLCSKSYRLPPPNDSTRRGYELTEGSNIWIPTYSLHHDPAYYPEPETFDPERFSDENKPNIKPFTFIPFGVGPRFCIGARFAVLEAKVVIFYLLANFNIITTDKTAIPLKIAKNTFIMHSEGGFWLGLQSRKK